FDNMSYLFAKELLDLVDGDRRVFDCIMEKACGDCRGVQFHLGQDGGHFEGMNEVRLAGGALLSFMMLGRKIVSPLNEAEVIVRAILAHHPQQLTKSVRREEIGSELLAQSRHV